jgi:cytochrome c
MWCKEIGKEQGWPDRMAPDTKMDFYVPKAQERSDLIAYFKQ